MKTKICSKCGINKDLINFYKQKTCKDGLSSFCKDCKLEYDKNRQVNYWKTDGYKTSRLRKLYGINVEKYRSMLEKQNNVCAICGKEETTINKRSNRVQDLSVDHDHQSGKVRGLLCVKCNNLLGKVKDDVIILNRAILYLEDKLF